MRLGDPAAAGRLELRPLRYQFPTATGDPHDDNWLVVRASVTTPDGARSLTDPCLLTDEAQQLAAWLRAVAAGRVPAAGRAAAPRQPGGEDGLSADLTFIEPVLAFRLAGRSEDTAVLHVHLSAAGEPPWQECDEGADPRQPAVEVRLDTAALLHAADQWERALAPFPRR
ncbi:WapI family immunity protein [Streptomyces ficellus]|uniref:Uncharacterized protein n=1 Tax=Streptomyces ficellus TaxID=1977088 RepID=A0A6I6FGS2_9ACTN|nr:hypothetical protein [Streptomyces ficellus]QGV82311.1 hypothetical protein EIZ62_31690 [Streptomyces ficellus]